MDRLRSHLQNQKLIQKHKVDIRVQIRIIMVGLINHITKTMEQIAHTSVIANTKTKLPKTYSSSLSQYRKQELQE